MNKTTFEKMKTYFDSNQHNWSKQELDDYNKIFIREADDRGKITLAEKRGEQKGKIDGKIETARNLKELGISIEIISQSTGLTQEEIEKNYFFLRQIFDFYIFLKLGASVETVLFCVRSSLKIFKNSVFFENFDENLMKNLRKMGENLRAGKHRGSPENLRSNFAFLPPEKPPKNPRKTPIFTRIFPDFCSKKSTVCCRIL